MSKRERVREREREEWEKERHHRGRPRMVQHWAVVGGIWVKQSQPDRRKQGDGGVIWLIWKGASQTEGNGY